MVVLSREGSTHGELCAPRPHSLLVKITGLLVAAVLSVAALSGAPALAFANDSVQADQANDVSLMVARIDTVKLTGDAPEVGGIPATTATPAEPWVYDASVIDWYDDTEGRWLDVGDTFIAGHEYTMQAWVMAQDGYAFLLDANDNNAPLVNGTFNGETAKVYRISGEDPNSCLLLVRSFEVAPEKVSSVKVLGVDAPVAGATPDYTASVGDPSLYWLAPYGFGMSGMWWYDSEGAALSATDTFKGGETYQLEIKLVAAMDGLFPQSEFATPMTATVNNKNVLAVNIWATEDTVYLYLDYECESTEAFSNLWETFPDVASEVAKVGGPDKVWYVADGWLDYVVQNGLMGGYASNGYFAPRDKLTRGQVATMLYRAELAENPLYYYSYGSTTDPTAYATSSTFKDVKGKLYYTAAINWAKDAGIMTGDASTNYTTVRPDAPVTRQELVTMLCRYAISKHVNTITDQSIAAYSDANKVANWAKPSVAWAVERGIMGGAAKLNPTGNATRAEAAKMFTVAMRDVIVSE